MDQNELITFNNPAIGELRGFIKDGEPWFIAGKVCDCLKLKNSRDVLKGVEERHLRYGDKIKGVGISYILLNTTGGKQKVTIISEAILYELVFRSSKEKAFRFQQWVFEEVLPSLRKHGEYRMTTKMFTKSLNDTIKTQIVDKTDNPNVKRFAYSNIHKMVNKSLGLPPTNERDQMSDKELERIARRENLVNALMLEGKTAGEIKNIIADMEAK